MNARDLSYIALSVALISVSAWIAIPLGTVLITMQTAIVCLLAGLLGTKRATLAVLSYILLGTLGAPVFAGFTGGVGRLLAPTGGYIVGFLAIALTVGAVSDWMKKHQKGKLAYLMLAMALGVLLCYTLGTIWFMCLSVQNGEYISILSVLSVCVFPYIPFDILKVILAMILMKKMTNIVKTT